MKPTKNRVFCRNCNRHKMLFETEKKPISSFNLTKKKFWKNPDIARNVATSAFFAAVGMLQVSKKKLAQPNWNLCTSNT